jgi:hypothetical protein
LTARRGQLLGRAAYAGALVFCGLYFFQSSTMAPSHTDEGLILECIDAMAHGKRPYFDFADAYGLLNWVFPVAFYKAFGYRVWGVRMWMLLLKVITVATTYVLVRALADEKGPAAEQGPGRRRGRLFAGAAFVGVMVLLGAQWRSLQTAYAFITVMPLTLGAWYFLLASPFRDPRRGVIAAAVLTACTIWTKLNTGMYLFSGGLFAYFFWVPVRFPGKYSEDRGLLAHPNARRWFAKARLLGAGAYAAIFFFSIRQHFNVWFFLYLVVPLVIGLVWTATVTDPERDPATPLVAHLAPFLLYLQVTLALSVAVFFAYYGSHAFAYARELSTLLSSIKYTAPFPALGKPAMYVGLNEYYWLQLPWLLTALFGVWLALAHRFGERAYGKDWPKRRAQASTIFVLMTLHSFVMYARSDETHIYQALVLDVPAICIVLAQIDAFIGAFRATSTFPLRLAVITFGSVYVSTLWVLPTADTFAIGPGDWSSPKLEHIRFSREKNPNIRDFSPDISDREWDKAELAVADYVKSISVPGEEMLLLTANQLVYLNSDTTPVGGRYHFFFYLASVGLLDRAGFDRLVPRSVILDLGQRPPRVIVSSIGFVPLAETFPEFVWLRDTWYAQTAHFRHILVYELRMDGEPVQAPLR